MSHDARKLFFFFLGGGGGLQPDLIQSSLCNYRSLIEALNQGLKKKRDCSMHEVKT